MTSTPRSDPIPNHLYTDAWNDYRRRLQLVIGVWLGGFLLVAAFIYALSLAAGPGWLGMIIAACWLVAFAIAAIRLQLFKCPRCRNPFFSHVWYYWPFARKCVHCGLRRLH